MPKETHETATPQAEAPQPQAAPEPSPPPVMTLQAFADEVNALIDRAQAAGLQPMPVLGTIIAKRGMTLVDQLRVSAADFADRFLASLEGNHAKTEKK